MDRSTLQRIVIVGGGPAGNHLKEEESKFFQVAGRLLSATKKKQLRSVLPSAFCEGLSRDPSHRRGGAPSGKSTAAQGDAASEDESNLGCGQQPRAPWVRAQRRLLRHVAQQGRDASA
jgi:hypothetical protein